MKGIYHSSIGPRVSVSYKMKQLMQELRAATHECVRNPTSLRDTENLSRVRLALVQYVARLEDDLTVHQAQRAEQQRREYERTRRGSDGLYQHQRDAVAFMNRYSYRYSYRPTSLADVFGTRKAATLFGVDVASKPDHTAVFRTDFREIEKRVTMMQFDEATKIDPVKFDAIIAKYRARYADIIAFWSLPFHKRIDNPNSAEGIA